MRERLHYIDLAKGLLILMVAYGHVWYHICHNDGFNNVYMSELHELSNVWAAFYMPAFFVITGMCSNFERTWKTFWTSQLKSLILPAFTLGLVVNAISWLLSDSEFHLGLKVFLKGNGFWFLSSLFVAKIIFYCLNKFAGNMKTIVFVTIILYSAFVVVHNFFSMVPNYWCWIHAFGLFPYLVLGQALRRWNVMKHNRILLAAGGGIRGDIAALLKSWRENPKNYRRCLCAPGTGCAFSDFICYRNIVSAVCLQKNQSRSMA